MKPLRKRGAFSDFSWESFAPGQFRPIETTSKAKDYFAKGHLAPDANFVYEVLQDATYYFINVAPQVRLFWIPD